MFINTPWYVKVHSLDKYGEHWAPRPAMQEILVSKVCAHVARRPFRSANTLQERASICENVSIWRCRIVPQASVGRQLNRSTLL
jgi:hypothetical protein